MLTSQDEINMNTWTQILPFETKELITNDT